MKMDIVTALRTEIASPFLIKRWMRTHGDPWKRYRDQISKFLRSFLLPAGLMGVVTWAFYDPEIGLFDNIGSFHGAMAVILIVTIIIELWPNRVSVRAEREFVQACWRLQEMTGPYHQTRVGLLGEAELADAAKRCLVHLAKNKLLIERNDGPMRKEEEKRHGQIFKEAWEFLYLKFILVGNSFEPYYADAEHELQAVFRDAPQTVEPPAVPAVPE